MKKVNRRDFIHKIARGIVFSGIVAGGGYLLLKPRSDEKCDLDFICQNCKKSKTCSLPEAEEFNKKNELSTN